MEVPPRCFNLTFRLSLAHCVSRNLTLPRNIFSLSLHYCAHPLSPSNLNFKTTHYIYIYSFVMRTFEHPSKKLQHDKCSETFEKSHFDDKILLILYINK